MNMFELAAPILEALAGIGSVIDSEPVIAGLVLVITAGAIGLCVPGLLVPISFSAGLLLDGWLAIAVVASGAVMGSHGLFLAARHGLGGAIERRLAGRLERFAPHLANYGFFYVAGLRMVGTPHALVTLASAASPLGHRSFALATLLGFLPAIALSAGAASAI